MITLPMIYDLAGLMFAAVAIQAALDRANPRRFFSAGFWGLYAVNFLAGSYISDFANGLLVLAMVGLAAAGLGRGAPPTTTDEQRAAGAARFGNILFVPALLIPGVTLLGSLVLKSVEIAGRPLMDPMQATLISLGLGVVVALIVALALLRPPALAPVREARRLVETIGWAAVLPQMLAALGAVFAVAGVGTVIAGLLNDYVPLDTPLLAVIAYAVGMALFTAIMGNAFAAFPVMTAAVGLPLVVHKFGGDPHVVCALGMLSGFCGTLVTPMAANFNIVPAALLELPDRNGVIRVQVPTALILLLGNIVLMYVLAFSRWPGSHRTWPTASPASPSAMSPANTRTSWTTCWPDRRMRWARRRCIRSSMAVSTGIPVCTATGCWPICCGAFRTCRTPRPYAPCSTGISRPNAWPASAPIWTAPARAGSSVPMAGPGC